MHLFEDKKSGSYHKLIGLDQEYFLIEKFCDLIWSPQWKEYAEIFRFMPTILLYGPPGTGKTSLLGNFASKLDTSSFKYYRESLDLLVNKELGDTSKAIKSLFDEIKEQANCGKKVFLQIDDVDSLLSSRYLSNESSGVRRGVNTFLTQLDELLLDTFEYMPIISATTNMLDYLDSAVKRRFSLKVEVNPKLGIEDIEDLIRPMINTINSDININHNNLAKIVLDKELTPSDTILVMQKVLLKHITGSKFSEQLILDELCKIESSKITFEQQRNSFSSLNKDE